MALFGGSGIDQFKDEIDSFAAEYLQLLAEDTARIKRYTDYRAECEATRETQLDVNIGATDYGRDVQRRDGERTRTRFNFPFGQALTVKHQYRIAGRLPDAIVDRRRETPEERHRSDTMEKIWRGVLRESQGDVQFADAAWDSSQVGAAPFQIYFDVKRDAPYFTAIDPAACLVVKGLDDPHDFQRVYRWWQVPLGAFLDRYKGASFRGVEIPFGDVRTDINRQVTIVQMASKTRTLRFAVDSDKGIGGFHIPLEEKEHRYGFAPYIVIPNLGPYRNVWGWSDYEFIREIARYIPVMFGREADVLAMVANGAYQAKGTKATPAQIRKILAEGGVIPTGREGEISPIDTAEMPAFSQSHAVAAFDILERLGFAPPAAWGAAGSSSGSDRGLQLQPMTELTSMKQKNWSAGLSRLGKMGFELIDRFQSEPRQVTGTYQRSAKSRSFNFLFGPGVPAQTPQNPASDNPEDLLSLPMNPTELFAGDHRIRFVWQNRIDKDDPAFVASELNKFAQGVQSLRTTLENLGVEAPEDEIKLIEQENEDHPWLRQGMIKLLELQMAADQQGANDGSQNVPQDPLGDAQATMNQKDGRALDLDAMTAALPGAVGVPGGGA